MLERLGGDEVLAEKLMPDWEAGCRRATPGPGYLESFTKDNVSPSLVLLSRLCRKICFGVLCGGGAGS